MNEGEVHGYDVIECPFCGKNNWLVNVAHSYDGPYVTLGCLTSTPEDCVGSIHISINQSMVLY